MHPANADCLREQWEQADNCNKYLNALCVLSELNVSRSYSRTTIFPWFHFDWPTHFRVHGNYISTIANSLCWIGFRAVQGSKWIVICIEMLCHVHISSVSRFQKDCSHSWIVFTRPPKSISVWREYTDQPTQERYLISWKHIHILQMLHYWVLVTIFSLPAYWPVYSKTNSYFAWIQRFYLNISARLLL